MERSMDRFLVSENHTQIQHTTLKETDKSVRDVSYLLNS